MHLSDKDMAMLSELVSAIEFDINAMDDVEFGWCSNCNNDGGNNGC